jgi:hypothetical protein
VPEDQRATQPGRREGDVSLKDFLEVQFKQMLTEALQETRHMMRNEFASVAAKVEASNLQNAAAHATNSVKLDNLAAGQRELQKLEPRLATVEADQKAESAVAVAVDKMRDWNLRLVVAMAGIFGLAIAFLH